MCEASFRKQTLHKMFKFCTSQRGTCHFCSFPLLKLGLEPLTASSEQTSSRVLGHNWEDEDLRNAKLPSWRASETFFSGRAALRIGSAARETALSCMPSARLMSACATMFCIQLIGEEGFFIWFIFCIWPAQHVLTRLTRLP